MPNGLSNDQRRELGFIRHLVRDVDAFNSEKFKALMQQYEKADADIFTILKTSRERAQVNYERFLQNKVLGIGSISGLGFEKVVNGEQTVLGHVANTLRDEAYKDKEFRAYLSKSLLDETQNYDRELKKAYRESEREKRIEDRKLGKRVFSLDFSR